jgi:hypothetical protein
MEPSWHVFYSRTGAVPAPLSPALERVLHMNACSATVIPRHHPESLIVGVLVRSLLHFPDREQGEAIAELDR